MFSNKHNLKPNHIELLTGRVPGEMKILDKQPTVEYFTFERLRHFDIRISTTFKKMTAVAQNTFLYNLDYIFGLKISPIASLRISETAMDAGLFYYDSYSLAYKFLSNLASQSLMEFFLDHVEKNMVPIFSSVCYSEETNIVLKAFLL